MSPPSELEPQMGHCAHQTRMWVLGIQAAVLTQVQWTLSLLSLPKHYLFSLSADARYSSVELHSSSLQLLPPEQHLSHRWAFPMTICSITGQAFAHSLLSSVSWILCCLTLLALGGVGGEVVWSLHSLQLCLQAKYLEVDLPD